MAYDLTIKTYDGTLKKEIKDLKEFKEIFKQYDGKNAEIKLQKVKTKKLFWQSQNKMIKLY